MDIFPKLNIGNLQIDKPIIQGGMSVGVSLSGLAAAVANEGGVGVLGTAGIGFQEEGFAEHPIEMNLNALKREIHRARELTDGIIGVNIMRALTDFNELLQTSILEKVDIVFIGAGLPLAFPKGPAMDNLKTFSTKIVPIVSSSKAVKVIFKYWQRHYDRLPDAIVVEGPKAGGHLGFSKPELLDPEIDLKNIVADVLNEIRSFGERLIEEIPVIAAGGIFDKDDMMDMFEAGVKGVQLGTRFAVTEECDASDKFKQQFINAKKDDIVLIDSPVGMPGRAIMNDFLKKVAQGEKFPANCPFKCLHTCNMGKAQYCIANALTNAKLGNMESGFAFAGTNAYRINKVFKVKDIFRDLTG